MARTCSCGAQRCFGSRSYFDRDLSDYEIVRRDVRFQRRVAICRRSYGKTERERFGRIYRGLRRRCWFVVFSKIDFVAEKQRASILDRVSVKFYDVAGFGIERKFFFVNDAEEFVFDDDSKEFFIKFVKQFDFIGNYDEKLKRKSDGYAEADNFVSNDNFVFVKYNQTNDDGYADADSGSICNS